MVEGKGEKGLKYISKACERIWRLGSLAGVRCVFSSVRAALQLIVAEMVIEYTGDNYPP